MDFYLSDSSGVRLRFPMVPDRLNVKTGALSVSFNIIKRGEVKIPRGSTLTGYSWNGTLPGRSMRAAPLVFDWQEPQRIIDLLNYWQENGETLRFMATELSISADVFIEALSYEFFGADSVSYQITLTMRRGLLISTTQTQTQVPNTSGANASNTTPTSGVVSIKNTSSYLNVRQKPSTGSKSIGRLNHGARITILRKDGNWYVIPYSGGTNGEAYVYSSYVLVGTQSSTSGSTSGSSGNSASGSKKTSGSTSGTSTTYTVQSGDSLYSIAKKTLGSGSRYTEIYELNKAAIDKRNAGKPVSKYTIYAGQVFKLPSN